MGLAYETRPDWYEYFLNPANHQTGRPLDMISYHCLYTTRPIPTRTTGRLSNITLFDKADLFLQVVRL